MSNPVVHFEMPYEDAKRVAEFYKTAFGWNMIASGEEMGNYVVAETTQTENGRAKTPGAINGGFFPSGSALSKSPSVVIAVEDIEVAMKNITAAGGKILGEPKKIPRVGNYVSFSDSEGNIASLLQPMM